MRGAEHDEQGSDGGNGAGHDKGEDRLDNLVAECLEAVETNDWSVMERVCREHPDLAETIRSRVQRIAGMGLVKSDEDPERIGPYRVLESIGHGGMGTVYLAEQREPVRRKVALKVIKLGMDTREVIRRFEAERQALALMNHAHIARVFDAGRTEEGRPFFAMEYVPGLPVTQYCDKHRLGLKERIELLLPVCEAVQHAHLKGVIHRDLKPTNILVAKGDDGTPLPKVIDFGVAKATDRALTDGTLYTSHGQLVGTPEYMSPEQASLQPFDVDARTDVYALGAVLYELLSGVLPFDPQRLRAPGEMFRILQDEDPPAPSTRFAKLGDTGSIVANRATEARVLQRELRGDLDWIVLKALEKERTRRYPTPLQLADDLRRYLALEPVTARPPSTSYRVSKFVRKHRVAVAVVALLVLGLVGGVIGMALESVRANRLAKRESAAREDLEKSQARYRLLAVLPMLDKANQDASAIRPAWPENTARFEQWWSEFGEPLASRRDDVDRAVEDMKARFGDEIEDPNERFLFGRLVEAQKDLTRFMDVRRGAHAYMKERLAWSRSVQQRSIDDPRRLWKKTLEEIRTDPRYNAILQPQMGLLPIGRDPESKLQEFAHLRSGEPAKRDPETGKLEITDETGIVFVLLPAGTFEMGSQASDISAARFHRQAAEWESPIHTVGLPAPFFLSKYEMTKGQWARLKRGERPCFYQKGEVVLESGAKVAVDDTFPVEQVSWQDCHDLLEAYALMIPTEAQWEYACRAGTDSHWWPGDDRDLLVGVGNFADKRAGAVKLMRPAPEWRHIDDGHSIYAAADALRANPWGFHHIHGNLWEWTRDSFLHYRLPVKGIDAERRGTVRRDPRRVFRGGGYSNPPWMGRSSMRWHDTHVSRKPILGIRPARRVLRVD